MRVITDTAMDTVTGTGTDMGTEAMEVMEDMGVTTNSNMEAISSSTVDIREASTPTDGEEATSTSR